MVKKNGAGVLFDVGWNDYSKINVIKIGLKKIDKNKWKYVIINAT